MIARDLPQIGEFHNHEELRITAAKAITHIEQYSNQADTLASFFMSAYLAADAANAA